MQITYIIQKSRRRSISVSIMADNKVLVKAPYGTTERMVQEFLVVKKGWITKHLESRIGKWSRRNLLFFLLKMK